MTNENVTLPLLPLTSGVVLPGMVFTMALESDEARAAVDSARSAGGRLLLVPHIEGRFAAVGVIAEVMEEGELPGGLAAVAIRGDRRAVIGTGVPGTGDALWVEAEPLDEPEPSLAANELAREYRAVLENILHSRGAGRIAAQLREIHDPSRLADMAGYSPDLSLQQKVEVLETRDVEARLRLVLVEGLGLHPQGVTGAGDAGADGGAAVTADHDGGKATGEVALLHDLGDDADLGETTLDVGHQQQAPARGAGRFDGGPGLFGLERHGEDHAGQDDTGLEGKQWECHILVRHWVPSSMSGLLLAEEFL